MRAGRTWLVAGVAAAVVAAGAGTAYARAQGADSGTYRTVAATTGSVEQTLSTTGTVDSADRANVVAGVGGTVATVTRGAGDAVAAGDVLLRLDTTDLRASLDQANAALASARAQLDSDQEAQSSTVSTATTGQSGGQSQQGKPTGQTPKGQAPQGHTPSTPSTPGTPSAPTPSPGATAPPVQTQAVKDALADLKDQQDAVTSAESDATGALKDASDALSDQTTACGNAYKPGVDPDPDANAACQAALASVQDKQQAADDAQQKLTSALSDLTATLDDAVAKLDAASASAASYRTLAGAGAAGRIVATSAVVLTADQPDASQTVTAATLAKDQASIDTARADVLEAQQALTAAVVRAPIAGTVAQLDLKKGDPVSAGDTAAVVTDGSALIVTSSVGETTIRSIAIGQPVRVSTPGSTTSSTGRVTTIGLTADTTSGSASYPVTIAVPSPEVTLPVGSSVLVEIVLATANDVVTVPTSAVTRVGTRPVVRIVRGGVPTTVPVTLGARGERRVAITEGLSSGTRVVLADLNASVTGASTILTNRAGFPGAGGQGGPGTQQRRGSIGGRPGS